jgi:hypothetical protein
VTDALLAQADAIAAMPDGLEKTRVMTERFGRSGLALIPLLNQGSEALRKQFEEADKLGIVIDTKTAAAAERFNDNLTRLKSSMDAAWLTIAEGLLPTLVQLTDSFIVSATEGGNLSSVLQFLTGWVKGVIVGVDALVQVLGSLADMIAASIVIQWQVFNRALQATLQIFPLLLDSLKAIGAALKDFGERLGTITTAIALAAQGNWVAAAGVMKSATVGLGDELERMRDRLVANSARAAEVVKVQATGVFEEIRGLSQNALDEMSTRWSNFWERSMGSFSMVAPPGAGGAAAGGPAGPPTMTNPLQYAQPIGPGIGDEASFGQVMMDRLLVLGEAFTQFSQNAANAVAGGIGSAIDTVSDGIWQVIDGTATWGQLFQQVARSIISDLIRIALQYVIGKLIMMAIDRVFHTQSQQQSTQTATTASVAGLGKAGEQGGWVGLIIYLALLAAGIAAVVAMTSGFAAGGITPGKATPAIVGEEGPEFVVNARGLREVGPGFLEGINAGLIGAADIAAGVPAAVAGNVPQGAAGAGRMMGEAQGGRAVVVVVVNTEADAMRVLESEAGQARIVHGVTGQRIEIGIPT